MSHVVHGQCCTQELQASHAPRHLVVDERALAVRPPRRLLRHRVRLAQGSLIPCDFYIVLCQANFCQKVSLTPGLMQRQVVH